jgi:hypothetical protein
MLWTVFRRCCVRIPAGTLRHAVTLETPHSAYKVHLFQMILGINVDYFGTISANSINQFICIIDVQFSVRCEINF